MTKILNSNISTSGDLLTANISIKMHRGIQIGKLIFGKIIYLI